MLNFSKVSGCPVLSKKDLCIIGNLKDCIFDENLNQIAYFLCIKDDGEFLVSAKDISAINDAFVLDDCSLVRHVEDVDFTTLKTIVGKSVYTDNGHSVGVVQDLTFDNSGKVGQVLLENGTLKTADILGVGEIVILKTAKRRKKKGSVNLTALALEDKPVVILDTDNSSKDTTTQENPVSPFESQLNNEKSKSSSTIEMSAPALSVAQEQVPPRIISDYNFLLGRMLTDDLYTYQGEIIAYKNTAITIAVVDKARMSGKLLELTYNSK
ncbi:MAG: PRC-barrel domain-containing protein [Clostridia bacterium]|nr:PRC-barrel domain-containing protein [Clostridia bacterium]